MIEGGKVGALIKIFQEETKNRKEEKISIAIKITHEVGKKRIIHITMIALLTRIETITIDLSRVLGVKDQNQDQFHLHLQDLLIQIQDQDQRAAKNIKGIQMIGDIKKIMIRSMVVPEVSLEAEIQKGKIIMKKKGITKSMIKHPIIIRGTKKGIEKGKGVETIKIGNKRERKNKTDKERKGKITITIKTITQQIKMSILSAITFQGTQMNKKMEFGPSMMIIKMKLNMKQI